MSSKKASEGLALLSMYNDEEEDDDMEDVVEESRQLDEGEEKDPQQVQDEYMDDGADENRISSDRGFVSDSGGNDRTAPHFSTDDDTQSHKQREGLAAVEAKRVRTDRLTIVDYGHDELAMSPEPEEGDLGNRGQVMFGLRLQSMTAVEHQENAPSETVQILSPSVIITPHSEHQEQSQTENPNDDSTESGDVEGEHAIEDADVINPLDKFLPPPPKAKCSEELQGNSSRSFFTSLKEPLDTSLLYSQPQHMSQHSAQDTVSASTRDDKYWRAGKCWVLDPMTRHWVDVAGFGWAADISRIKVDAGLLHALTERWRPETHTFHLRWGEMTVTLKDVQILLGLRVNGPPVSDQYRFREGQEVMIDLSSLCPRLLGVVPSREKEEITKNDVSLSWLKRVFEKKEGDSDWIPATEEEAIMRARGYILHLLGTFLFSNTSGNKVALEYLPLLEDLQQTSQYSWGSAVLSYLYSGLCKAVAARRTNATGCAVLLQLWSWEHLSVGRPMVKNKESIFMIAPLGMRWVPPKTSKKNPQPRVRQFYRDELTAITQDQIIWDPYGSGRLGHLPQVCIEDGWCCMLKLPLIHFNIVEWHMVDRVWRQFSFNQSIPKPFEDRQEWDRLHKLRWEKNTRKTWITRHAAYWKMWESRSEMELPRPVGVPLSEYLSWYSQITVTLIGDPPVEVAEEQTVIPSARFKPHGNESMLLMRSIRHLMKLTKKILKKATGRQKKHAEEQLKIMWYTHELIGETEQYNQLLTEPVTSSEEEEVPNIRFDETYLQPLVTQSTQEQSQPDRSAKSRNVSCRHGSTSKNGGKGRLRRG